MSDTTSTRRDFLKAASAGAVALSLNASTYARAAGANERISIGIIGCGQRGFEAHMPGIHKYAADQNIEITAVCDPWRQKREAAAAKAKEWYGREARQFVSYLDLLAADNIDAVTIASCDHQHTTHLEAAAKAKKDVYCEKPLAMDLEKLKSSCDAVRENGVVFQAGTQLRSLPSFTGCRELFKAGVLGNVARIEQRRNGSQPYWYSRLDEVKEEDVDWKEFLMDRPMRPFNADQYSGWYGYRDFSDGPVPGFGTHFLDLVHYITGAKYPTSAVSVGGVFTWKDEHDFTCPDNVQAEWIYPEGFLVSYSTNFGNGSGNSFKIFGNKGSMDLIDWDNPVFTDEGIVGVTKESAVRKPIEGIPTPDHFLNWLECLRTRKTPNADIEAAYQHGIASLLAVRAFDTGTRQIYDQEKREFRAG
jgi:predicted dehydrogenase